MRQQLSFHLQPAALYSMAERARAQRQTIFVEKSSEKCQEMPISDKNGRRTAIPESISVFKFSCCTQATVPQKSAPKQSSQR